VTDHAANRMVRASLERYVAASARQRAALARLLWLLDTDVLALEHVLRASELSAVALARRMPLSSGGTAAVIDRLCAAGLMSRTRDPRDRRRVVLRATPRVERRLDGILAPLVADIDALTRDLSATQRAPRGSYAHGSRGRCARCNRCSFPGVVGLAADVRR
jgi:DNA-binding MarR family transcriptional regulator